MTVDDLRALLDAAAKATPGKWEVEEAPFSVVVRRESWDQVVATTPRQCNRDYIAVASPDVVAALARIALAAVQWGHSATSITTWDQFEADERSLYDALRDAGLLTTAPQEPQP